MRNVIPKVMYDFTDGSATFVAARNVDVRGCAAADLLVRVHQVNIASGSSITVEARASSPSSDDPAVDFVEETALASLSFDDESLAGELGQTRLSVGMGAFLEISVVGVLGVGNCQATISADLVTRG